MILDYFFEEFPYNEKRIVERNREMPREVSLLGEIVWPLLRV